jgi:hypothetical protein
MFIIVDDKYYYMHLKSYILAIFYINLVKFKVIAAAHEEAQRCLESFMYSLCCTTQLQMILLIPVTHS